MKIDVQQEVYEAIGELIQSSESPVGIDAKKTHILILDKLIKIEERLARLEAKLEAKTP